MRKIDWLLFRMPVAAIVLLLLISINTPGDVDGSVLVRTMEGSRVLAERLGAVVSWVLWVLMPLVIVLSPVAMIYGIWQHREGGPYVASREVQKERFDEARRWARAHPITPELLEALRKRSSHPVDTLHAPHPPTDRPH